MLWYRKDRGYKVPTLLSYPRKIPNHNISSEISGSNIHVLGGVNTRLTCVVSGISTATTIKWYTDNGDDEITDGVNDSDRSGFDASSKKQTSTLSLSNVGESAYVCKAIFSNSEASTTLNIYTFSKYTCSRQSYHTLLYIRHVPYT